MWQDFFNLYCKYEFLVDAGGYGDTMLARELYSKCLSDMAFRQRLSRKWRVSNVIT